MKNIQEIIKEMEKISEQVATTVNLDEEPLTPEEAEGELADILDNAPEASGDPSLGTACCIVSVSNAFTVPTDSGSISIPATNLNLLYTTSQLSCCVNPITVTCTPPDCPGGSIQATAYEVRLLGCIPYIANVSPIGGTSICETSTGTTRVSCSGTFCVNKRIGVYATQSAARAICNSTALLSCTNITANYSAIRVPTCGNNGQVVQFRITFNSAIGNCP